jgi:hypothetical protein
MSAARVIKRRIIGMPQLLCRVRVRGLLNPCKATIFYDKAFFQPRSKHA